MKKFLILLIVCLVCSALMQAATVTVSMNDGQKIKGEFITCSESVLIIERNTVVGMK